MTLDYLTYVARFCIVALLNPYFSNTPCSPGLAKWAIDFHVHGFILWKPGIKRKKCGRRICVSWSRILNREFMSWREYQARHLAKSRMIW